VVNTRGSHADLTDDYAAVPAEMKAVAAFFGKSVLREVDEAALLPTAAEIRESCGDRAFLRALHFFNENRRVEAMSRALEEKDLPAFLALVNESGDSSWELLQNIYPPSQPQQQGLSVALALSKNFFRVRGLGEGEAACRVHGGGFAGTIQGYLPLEHFAAYSAEMERVFGADSLTELRIRPLGAAEILTGT
jgi:galactokinase